MEKRIITERFYDNGSGTGVSNRSLSHEYELPLILDRGETVIPTINNTKAIEVIESVDRSGVFKTQVGIAKAHKKCFGDEEIMSWEEYRQYVLDNYDIIEQYYHDRFNGNEDSHFEDGYPPEEEFRYGWSCLPI